MWNIRSLPFLRDIDQPLAIDGPTGVPRKAATLGSGSATEPTEVLCKAVVSRRSAQESITSERPNNGGGCEYPSGLMSLPCIECPYTTSKVIRSQLSHPRISEKAIASQSRGYGVDTVNWQSRQAVARRDGEQAEGNSGNQATVRKAYKGGGSSLLSTNNRSPYHPLSIATEIKT